MSILVSGADAKTRKLKIEELIGQSFAEKNLDILKIEQEAIGIETVRQTRNWLSLTPRESQIRTLVIYCAQNLSLEAQNALLKTLEEPPPEARIILELDRENLLLPTVVSRCQVIDLGEYSPKAGGVDKDEMIRILSLLEGDLGKRFKLAQEHSSDRARAQEFLESLILETRDRLLAEPKAATRLRLLLRAQKMLLANTNVRLTLENLFLNW